MITKEDLSKFNPQTRTFVRKALKRSVEGKGYEKEVEKFILHGIIILCEMVFTNAHGEFKGMPKARKDLFDRFFFFAQFSTPIESMVRSGVFYNIGKHTFHLSLISGHDMEKPVLTEYARLYLQSMLARYEEEKLLSDLEGACQASPMEGFDFSACER